jgi:hypothetical protein
LDSTWLALHSGLDQGIHICAVIHCAKLQKL